ncbi:arylesterase [Lacimicrobium alkaliphilum]|uniref:Arylesterase n=1 Tax=Lacimicrobium alkaliphilum TaxID=1526571 RepID=A0ABQ1R580_9ALTE|nr:arylesterase [Lacimicrobium alkaliphilum]GGD55305.1 arylesterase [Lacimicrobium alkaliphilum]
MFSFLKIILTLIPFLLFSDQLKAEQVRLLILGDSLSAAYGMKQEQGWVTLLQDALKPEDITVINAAVSGETTDGGLARLPRLLDQHQPSHMLIELGGNDGLRGYPVSKLKANISAMITMAEKRDIDVILQQMQIPTNFGRRYNQMFTQSYQTLAEQHDVPLIPFFLKDIALDDKMMQKDRIHPSVEAQPFIARYMQKQLMPYLSHEEISQ